MAQKQTQIEQVTAYAQSLDRRPFTYRDVMRDLGFGKARAIMTMAKLKRAGIIQEIGRKGQGIYRLAPQLNKYEGAGPDDWTPSADKLQQILAACIPGKLYTAGKLAEMCIMPERTLYRYLECLVHLNVMAVRPNASGARFCYYRTANMLHKEIPAYNQFRGILGKLRQEWQEALDAEAEL